MPGGEPAGGVRLTVPGRYNGPADSAQGGMACGMLAALAEEHLGPRVAVTLHAPPPLDTPMELRPAGRRYGLYDGDRLVALAGAVAREPAPPPEPVAPEAARACAEHFTGEDGHPFPDCFVCGPRRADGLRLRPGPVPGRPGTVACPWHPGPDDSGRVPPALVWAALDCPGGWADDPVHRPMVLHRMAARVEQLPCPGREYVLTGRVVRRDGRTTENVTALYDAAGALLARAAATWIAVGPPTGTLAETAVEGTPA
ncbi:hypothetical protein [Streptomyces cacaoi]|uniref:hypothetical protein n=1 Tax=Streptomyces cacaoi TaxID=1898 RepID=UPI0033275289